MFVLTLQCTLSDLCFKVIYFYFIQVCLPILIFNLLWNKTYGQRKHLENFVWTSDFIVFYHKRGLYSITMTIGTSPKLYKINMQHQFPNNKYHIKFMNFQICSNQLTQHIFNLTIYNQLRRIHLFTKIVTTKIVTKRFHTLITINKLTQNIKPLKILIILKNKTLKQKHFYIWKSIHFFNKAYAILIIRNIFLFQHNRLIYSNTIQKFFPAVKLTNY